jgi:hypothetical protein
MCLACEADAVWELYLAQRAESLGGKLLPAEGDGNGVGADLGADAAATDPRGAPVAAFGCDDPAGE